MIQLLRKFSDKLLLTSTKSTTYYEGKIRYKSAN